MAAEKKNEVMAMRLKLLRIQNSQTQAELAKELGITQQTYSKYENVGAGLDGEIIMKLCRKYNVTSDYLLGLSDDDGRMNKTFGARDGGVAQIAYKRTLPFSMLGYGYDEIDQKDTNEIKSLLQQIATAVSDKK